MTDPRAEVRCCRCGREITEQTARRFRNAHTVTSTCDVCDGQIWDEIGWLTGTGRFAQ